MFHAISINKENSGLGRNSIQEGCDLSCFKLYLIIASATDDLTM